MSSASTFSFLINFHIDYLESELLSDSKNDESCDKFVRDLANFVMKLADEESDKQDFYNLCTPLRNKLTETRERFENGELISTDIGTILTIIKYTIIRISYEP